jgi:hypothetical protein
VWTFALEEVNIPRPSDDEDEADGGNHVGENSSAHGWSLLCLSDFQADFQKWADLSGNKYATAIASARVGILGRR